MNAIKLRMSYSLISRLSLIVFVAIHSNSYAETFVPSLNELTQTIKESEQQYTDIVDGAEKHIRWYQGKAVKSELSFVYIHGFSASRQELSPVTEQLADQFSANIFYTRLSGHGRSDDAMAEATVNHWKKDLQDAYNIGRAIGNQVIFISTSTGGTLVTWLLAQEDVEQPLGNIMISPNYAVQSSSAWLLKSSWGMKIAKLINGEYNSFTPISDAHAQYWTERYPLDAVTPVMQLLDEVNKLDKQHITSPQFIVYSPDDKVIKPEKVVTVSHTFINSEVRLEPYRKSTDPYQHVLAGIACSPESTDHMVNLLSTYVTELLNKPM